MISFRFNNTPTYSLDFEGNIWVFTVWNPAMSSTTTPPTTTTTAPTVGTVTTRVSHRGISFDEIDNSYKSDIT